MNHTQVVNDCGNLLVMKNPNANLIKTAHPDLFYVIQSWLLDLAILDLKQVIFDLSSKLAYLKDKA